MIYPYYDFYFWRSSFVKFFYKFISVIYFEYVLLLIFPIYFFTTDKFIDENIDETTSLISVKITANFTTLIPAKDNNKVINNITALFYQISYF